MDNSAETQFAREFFEHEAAVLPCQIRPASNPLHARSGERLLMLALLADAINIFLKGAADRRLSAETRDWICGGGQDGQPVSFEDACDAVGIDPAAMRQRLLRIKRGRGARRTLILKPPAMSRGPVRVGTTAQRRHSRRRATT